MNNRRFNKYVTFTSTLLLNYLIVYKKSHAYETSTTCTANSSVVHEELWSTAEECLRTCREHEKPRYCYYHFTLEYYTTMNRACEFCRPKYTNQLSNSGECQCIEADGVEKTVLSINRMIPGPSIQVCQNDMVIVDVHNKIDGIEVSLHWHGIFQNGYQYYDGVPYVTQCPINSHNVFRYQFRAKNAGTHFYHSHLSVHKIDGQYGTLIVRKPPKLDIQTKYYDQDLPTHVLLLSDWMHHLSMERFPGRGSRLKGQLPQNILINGRGTWQDPVTGKFTTTSHEVIHVEAGKRYRIRMINSFSTVCLAQLNIEDHKLIIIAQDGEDVEPMPVDTIVTASGERVDFVLIANQPSNRSYWIQVRGMGECGGSLMIQQLAFLRYAEASVTLPPTERPTYYRGLRRGILYNPIDAVCNPEVSICVNKLKNAEKDEAELLTVDADYQFVIPFEFFDYIHQPRNFFTPGTFETYLSIGGDILVTSILHNVMPQNTPGPIILDPNVEALTCDLAKIKTEPSARPAKCVYTHNVKRGSIVEFVLYDRILQPFLSHPFHLHGYAFRIFDVGRFPDKLNITDGDIDFVIRNHRQRLVRGEYKRVPGKDTVVVPQGGWAIFRIKADNPGWWLCHCHFVWHNPIGMQFILHVGEPSDLPVVPTNFPRCGNFVSPVCPHD
ncbi:oxidoreductase OpS5-like [Venturia canescens]|uniref:oxidoreductase OpS5-like n=1 Tax=Venturia canescens TaxID=32260 RepID=UPI001C9C7B7A|nr:oxidoreductase OpS5-like [Venturia canescens]